jgi:lysophospholipase L1-like esterase
MRVLVFGDSITFGLWDSQGGWADRLKRAYLAEQIQAAGPNEDIDDPHQIINLGIGGNTSRMLLARLEHECQARYFPDWPLAIVVAIGANDSKMPAGSNENLVPIDEFRRNLGEIVQLARKCSGRVVLIGLFPLRDETVSFVDFTFTQAKVKAYDAVISEVAKEAGVPKVELFDLVMAREDRAQLYFGDGLHPNDASHELIYSLVKPAVKKLLTSE